MDRRGIYRVSLRKPNKMNRDPKDIPCKIHGYERKYVGNPLQNLLDLIGILMIFLAKSMDLQGNLEGIPHKAYKYE